MDGRELRVVRLGAATATLRDPSGDEEIVVAYSYLFEKPLGIRPGAAGGAAESPPES